MSSYQVVATADGSPTFFSEEFGQAFHNLSGAYQEALEKFVLPCKLRELAHTQPHIQLLDICFGLGYNAGVALDVIWQENPRCRVTLIGVERSPEVPRQACDQGLLFGGPDLWSQLIETGQVQSPLFEGSLWWGDARQTLQSVPLHWADAVFLDPFSPSACPELWTVEFLTLVAQCSRGYLTTYSCSATVRSALIAAGFTIGSTPPLGRPWPGTIASRVHIDLPPLSQMEQEHLQTRAAVPYRDPSLRSDRQLIRASRQREQQQSSLEPTSIWKKRWLTSAPSTFKPH